MMWDLNLGLPDHTACACNQCSKGHTVMHGGGGGGGAGRPHGRGGRGAGPVTALRRCPMWLDSPGFQENLNVRTLKQQLPLFKG